MKAKRGTPKIWTEDKKDWLLSVQSLPAHVVVAMLEEKYNIVMTVSSLKRKLQLIKQKRKDEDDKRILAEHAKSYDDSRL